MNIYKWENKMALDIGELSGTIDTAAILDQLLPLDGELADHDLVVLDPLAKIGAAIGDARIRSGAGVAAERAGATSEKFGAHFDEALSTLTTSDFYTQKARSEIHNAHAVTLLRRVIHAEVSDSGLVDQARQAFNDGARISANQRLPFRGWSTDASGISRHRAILEIMYGDIGTAAQHTLMALYQALRTQPEVSDSAAEQRTRSIVDGRALLSLAGVGFLAATRPVTVLAPVAKLRRQVASALLD